MERVSIKEEAKRLIEKVTDVAEVRSKFGLPR